MTVSTPKLPDLTAEPQRHPDCCLSLSDKLLSVVADVVSANLRPTTVQDASSSITRTKPKTILSVGSGSGLLEECLQRHIDSLNCKNIQSGSRSDPGVREEGVLNLRVEGVEVHQLSSSSSSSSRLPNTALNRYLPEDRRNTVMGTWEVSPRLFSAAASGKTGNNEQHDPEQEFNRELKERGGEGDDGDGGQVVALMFVYPRLPDLVGKYIDAISSVASPESVQPTSEINTIIYLGPKADWADFSPSFMRLAGCPAVTTFPTIKVFEGAEAGLLDYEMMGVVSFTLS